MAFMILTLFLSFISFSFAFKPLICSHVIVGGGVAGVYSAYELSKTKKNICLFEKENYLGGRIKDKPHNQKNKDLLYGLGALRVRLDQPRVFSLATELSIKFEKADYTPPYIQTRGQRSRSSDDLNLLAYPEINDRLISEKGSGTEDSFYDYMMEKQKEINEQMSLSNFIEKTLGIEVLQFLYDVSRFRGEFQKPVSFKTIFEYIKEEQGEPCCNVVYPIGGMSQFIKKMEEKMRQRGVKIFLNEPLLKLSKKDQNYILKTSKQKILTKKVLLALTPAAIEKIKGKIIEKITESPAFLDILGIEVVVINQLWPKAWWKELDLSRAWTNEHCLNFIEVPQNPYAADEFKCNQFWKNTLSLYGKEAVAEEIHEGLSNLFPEVNIPKALETHIQIWPSAWHWNKGQVSSTEIKTFAKKPLKKDSSLALASEAYYSTQAGWINAALLSAEAALKTLSTDPF